MGVPDTGLKFGFSLDGTTWSTEFVSGGAAYSNDNRIAFDTLVSGGLGEIYLLSSQGGNLTLFIREARFIPEPSAAILLALGVLALWRRR
jgi:hypothetical protein